MATTLGTQLGTQLGTELVDFTEADAIAIGSFDTSKLYALSVTAADAYATQPGGGEVGDAGGFGELLWIQIVSLTGQQYLETNRPTANPLAGVEVSITSGNAIQATAANTTTTSITTPTRALSPSDVGRVMVVGYQYDQPAGRFRLYADRQEVGAGTAMAAYVAATLATQLGRRTDATLGATGTRLLGKLSWRGNPALADIQAAFDATRTTGNLPSSIAGATATRRISLKSTLAAGSAPVASGDAAPASLPDTLTGAAADAYTRTGSPVVRVIDPSIDGRTSYGVIGYGASSYFEAPSLSRTSATGYWFSLWAIPWVITTSGFAFRHLIDFGRSAIYISNGSGVMVQAQGGAVNAPMVALTAAHVGQPALIAGVFRGSTFEGYINGVSMGAPVAATETGAANILRLGVNFNGGAAPGSFANDWSLHGYAMGRVVGGITAAEALAHYQACAAAGRVVALANKTEHLVDLTQDIAPAPTSGVPAQALDRIGTDHLARVGTGLQVSRRTERLYSYETTPILRGADALSSANYFESSFDDISAAGGWWWAMLLYMPAVTQAGATIGGAAAGNTGWDVRAGANNTLLNWYMGDGTAYTASGNAVVATGKVNLLAGAWDFGALRQRTFVNRTEVSTGVSRTAYAPPTAGTKIGLGRSPRDPSAAGGVRTLLGFAAGLGTPTLAQYQALCDAVQASESMQAIGGMTSVLVDLTADATGGALPAALSNRAGAGSFARVGAPTHSPLYARVFAW